MAISVIIRCRNEERWIGHAIQSVIDFCKEPEIIFIDNGSTDESSEIVRMFEHHVNIKRFSLSNYSPGKSLNLGVLEALNEHILILSAHCVLSKFNEKYVSDLLDSQKYVSIFGKQIPIFKGRKISRRYIWSNFGDNEIVNPFSENEQRYFLHNALALYNRTFILKNKFDEGLFGKEDRYWVNDIIKQGHSVLYDPNIECLHYWTPNGSTWKGIG